MDAYSVTNTPIEGTDLFVTTSIYYDTDSEDPRTSFSNAGTMIVYSTDYKLGDYQGVAPCGNDITSTLEYLAGLAEPSFDKENWEEWYMRTTGHYPAEYDYIHRLIKATNKEYLWMALDLGRGAEHISCHKPYYLPDTCDGIIFISKEDAVHEWGKKLNTKAVQEQALKYLQGEVETLSQWLSGEVYGFAVQLHEFRDPDDHNFAYSEVVIGDGSGGGYYGVEDACWGYYELDYCESEAAFHASTLELRNLPPKEYLALATSECPNKCAKTGYNRCKTCLASGDIKLWARNMEGTFREHAIAYVTGLKMGTIQR